MKYYVLPYCLKIWGTSIAFAPIIFFLIACFSNYNRSIIMRLDIGSLILGYFAFIVVGAILSFTPGLVFWVIGIIAYRTTPNPIHRKLIMSLIGSILTASTFLFLSYALAGDMVNDFDIVIMPIYCLCVVGSGLIYSFD